MTAKSKRGAAIAAAIVLHVVVVAILALSTPILRLPTARFAPDIAVDLERRAAASAHQATLAPKTSRSQTADAAPAPLRPHVSPIVPSVPAPTTVPLATAASAPAPAAPMGVAPSPAAPAAPSSAHRDWTVRTGGVDLRDLARGGAGGCGRDLSGRLTTAEQAACDRRIADLRAAEAPRVDAIPTEKRAYYDAVLQQREHGRYASFDEMHKMQLARGPGGAKSHGIDVNVGYHCTFKFGAGAKEANAAAGKKIGFPPCPIRLPGVDPTPP